MNQIFKKNVPKNVLFDLLEQISLKTEKYYVVDINSYRKILFHNLNTDFINTITEYYHLSKQFYATRKLTYNSFITIIRHICKSANIIYTSNMRYNESKYNIDYHIYHEAV